MTGHPALALAMAGAVVAAGCSVPPPTTLADLDGRRHTPTAVAPGRVHVLVFTSHECPIANAYAPTLQALAAAWRDAPVDLFLVHVDPDLTPAAARRHAADFALPGVILFDARHDLARRFGVERTPEAVVLTPAGPCYRGRIDDQWRALGRRAPAATSHDLAAAVAAALAGRAPPTSVAPGVGCLLPEPRR